jgi:hypothetical protein
VDLALSEEQRDLITSFAGLLGRASFPDQVRAAEPAGFDAALWRNLLETGALVMAVPEHSTVGEPPWSTSGWWRSRWVAGWRRLH